MWVEDRGRDKGLKRYRIRDRVAGKLVTLGAKGYPTKKSAQSAMAELTADQIRGVALVPRGGRLTLGEWLDEWAPSYMAARKPSARIAAEGIVRRYLRPALGAYPLDEITRLVVQRWAAEMLATGGRGGGPLSVKTVRNAHGLLHSVMRDAVAARLVATNPCERTGLPRRQHHEMRFLTPQEADRLLARVPPYWRPFVGLVLATGLRFGEVTGLRVRDVDPLACRLTVRMTTQELATAGLDVVDVEPKPGRSRRTVTLPKATADMLLPLWANRGRDERLFVPQRGGEAVRMRAFHREWRQWRAAADLDGLRVHDLRHTHAAWLISAGVPLTAVSRRLGHSSIAVTSDLYGHLLPEVDDAIVATLDASLPVLPGEQEGSTGEHRTGANRIVRPRLGRSARVTSP